MIRKDFDNPTAGLNHAHNQYLDIVAKMGIISLIPFLLFLITCILFFQENLSSKSKLIVYYSIFGMTSTIIYIAYMLTHAVLSHHQSTIFMLMTIIISFSSIVNIINRGES